MSQNVQKLILQASTRIGAGIGNAQTKLFANIKSVRVIRKIDARAHQTPDNDSLLNIDEKKPFHIACVGRWVELSATWYVTTTPCCVAYSLHTTYACVDDIDSEMLGCMYTHACISTLTNALCRVNSQQVCRHAVAQSSGWVPQLQMDSVGSVQHLPAPCSLVGDARNRWLQVRTELQTVGVARSASCKCVPCLVASLSFTHQACMASRPFTHRACMVSLSYLSAMHTWCVCALSNECMQQQRLRARPPRDSFRTPRWIPGRRNTHVRQRVARGVCKASQRDSCSASACPPSTFCRGRSPVKVFSIYPCRFRLTYLLLVCQDRGLYVNIGDNSTCMSRQVTIPRGCVLSLSVSLCLSRSLTHNGRVLRSIRLYRSVTIHHGCAHKHALSLSLSLSFFLSRSLTHSGRVLRSIRLSR